MSSERRDQVLLQLGHAPPVGGEDDLGAGGLHDESEQLELGLLEQPLVVAADHAVDVEEEQPSGHGCGGELKSPRRWALMRDLIG